MKRAKATLVWFGLDLRLDDNPALSAAAARGGAVVPVFIWAPEEEGAWAPGSASRWWLHHSLRSLDARLRDRGSRLIVRSGGSAAALRELALEANASAVFWNRRYEPAAMARDDQVKASLARAGCEAASFRGGLLFEPWEIRTRQGGPYQVFGAYWRACLAQPPPPEPLEAPRRLPGPARWPRSLGIDDLPLLPRIDWASEMARVWDPGAGSAMQLLRRFAGESVRRYDQSRDALARPGTSSLSPHLHFGEISPRQVWHRIRPFCASLQSWSRGASPQPEVHEGDEGPAAFLRQLIWREFAYHLLYHFPHTVDEPLREDFAAFPWRRDARGTEAWRRGRTGYPLVDAGMRQLWATGWMHNRARMIAASFLVKHLRIDWREGARWFWDTLVDADLANNTLGWQWTAGCGADAAPFFRIFNPVSQGERFDPHGAYVRRWVPELDRLPDPWIHRPWAAPAAVLRDAGVRLGDTYPRPVVDHSQARSETLAAYQAMKTRARRRP